MGHVTCVFLLYKCDFTTCFIPLKNILKTFIFISNSGNHLKLT